MGARRIVLIGAARSGTKVVRDVLAEATGAGRVPYDIGFVWRYGNESVPHDVLDPNTVTARTRRFVMDYIDGYVSGDCDLVFEKTVGNALRVPFVHEVLPNAAFVHLIRDGVDVSESTRRQWIAPPDRGYLVRKLRHFPVRLAPSYGRKYVASLARRYFNGDARVGSWGPRYPGIDDDIRTQDLLTVCARQWRRSIEEATKEFQRVDAPTVELRYERLLANPRASLEPVLAALGLEVDGRRLDKAVAMISPGRVGAGRIALTSAELASLDRELGPTLATLNYPPATTRKDSDDQPR